MGVATDTVTIKDDSTFLVSDLDGNLVPGPEGHGMYLHDTRYLSRLELLVNGEKPQTLSYTTDYNIAAKFHMGIHHKVELPGFMESERIERLIPNAVGITRKRYIDSGLVERLEFTNYHPAPLPVRVALRVGADFADIFEVRGLPDFTHSYVVQIKADVEASGRAITFRSHVQPRDGSSPPSTQSTRRSLRVECGTPPEYVEEVSSLSAVRGERLPEVILHYCLNLEPSCTVALDICFMPAGAPTSVEEEAEQEPRAARGTFSSEVAAMHVVYERWQEECTSVKTGDYRLDSIFKTATLDLRSLMRREPAGLVVTAGIPWYFTLFGRDSLITALQTLSLNPQIAIDTMRALSLYQAIGFDDFRDMEPGKILHELRRGDMTLQGEVPHSPYYGSVDSTLLFILLYSELFKWVDDPALFEELWPNVERALAWAEEYGDVDGDGYIELRRRSRKGILHQGWKDSDESIGGDLGPRPTQPLALVEVQGYWYAAMLGLAGTLRQYGSGSQLSTAKRLEGKATALKAQFNRDFWWPEEGYYAQALDASKRQVRAVTSNIGHCLWNGIIDDEKARGVVARLLEPGMLSGWGVRTMSMMDPSYNPMSYHNGSIWPHDNSLLIAGLRRYGFNQEMLRVAEEIFAAAMTFPGGRLPELYCGFERGGKAERESSPVPYPVSCSPQAWAAGTPWLTLQSILGLEAAAQQGTLKVLPLLPQGVDSIRLAGLRVGGSRVDVMVRRDGASHAYTVSASNGDGSPKGHGLL